MRGIKSHGMLLCASNAAHDAVEPLAPPEGAAVGERVWFGEGGKEQVGGRMRRASVLGGRDRGGCRGAGEACLFQNAAASNRGQQRDGEA
jgi:tRNA-binding EMAP/Myf-like protein